MINVRALMLNPYPGRSSRTPDFNNQTDASGNKLPVLDQSGNPVKDSQGNTEYIPLHATAVTRTGTNPRGQYALHFHRTGVDPTMPAATVNDVAVVDSPGWGIVNHSSNVNVSNSVVFNATGAAYVTEAGDEIGSFVDNIAIHSQGAGGGIEDRKNDNDFGQLGDGFWLQGGDVSLVGTIATGQRHSGFVFFPVGLNEGALGVGRSGISTCRRTTTRCCSTSRGSSTRISSGWGPS
jgi:hypothetical protein